MFAVLPGKESQKSRQARRGDGIAARQCLALGILAAGCDQKAAEVTAVSKSSQISRVEAVVLDQAINGREKDAHQISLGQGRKIGDIGKRVYQHDGTIDQTATGFTRGGYTSQDIMRETDGSIIG